MTLIKLKDHIEKLLAAGVDKDIPVKFRNNKGKFEDVDYSITSDDGKTLLFAEEWF